MTNEEMNKKAGELAEKVMSLSAGTLLLNMRFLAKAVSRLPFRAGGESLSCDGRYIAYDPEHILSRYRQNERLPVHDCLHVLLHCIFRHWHIGAGIDADRWDAACDIAAEALIMRIGAGFCGNEREDKKAEVILSFAGKVSPLTAEKIYAYFAKNNVSDETIGKYLGIFRTDDHSGWHRDRRQDMEYEPEELPDMIGLGEPDGSDEEDNRSDKDKDRNGNNKEDAEQPDNDRQDDPDEKNGAVQDSDVQDSNVQDSELEEWLEASRQAELLQLDKLWEQISREIQSELENFDKKAGEESRYLTDAIAEVNRDKCDYASFLKKFAVSGEAMKPDLDSFDSNLYSYGLSLYGNVALVEPLEYKEVKLVRDFVIAIDTSGSVRGELVKSFINRTYSILKSEESFFEKVNIHIIQCDTEVRDAVKITCGAELERYISEMEIKGLGGTDFRPVFEYVDGLMDRREFTSLKGLIYFTDGFGEFPAAKPPYDTAFAFIRSDYEKNEPPAVPVWAIKLILEEDDILYGR